MAIFLRGNTLKTKTSAEVYSDNFNKGRYATDASIYQMMPFGVLIPKTKSDLIETINYEKYLFFI